MLNYLALIGDLEDDPEIHYLGGNNDQPEASFGLVFSAGHNSTGRIKVTCFNRLAELGGRFLRQGTQLAVSGVLDQQQGETMDKRERHGFRLIGRSLELNETDRRGNTRVTPLKAHLPGQWISGNEPKDNLSKGGD